MQAILLKCRDPVVRTDFSNGMILIQSTKCNGVQLQDLYELYDAMPPCLGPGPQNNLSTPQYHLLTLVSQSLEPLLQSNLKKIQNLSTVVRNY